MQTVIDQFLTRIRNLAIKGGVYQMKTQMMRQL